MNILIKVFSFLILMSLPTINNRVELLKVLGSSLNSEDGEQDIDQKPKSFILESNMGRNIKFPGSIPLNVSIKDTKDSTLKILRIGADKERTDFFLDVNDERYWVLHSLDQSDKATKAIQRIVSLNSSLLDFPWMSSTQLEEVSKFGTETGFNLKFTNAFISNLDDNFENKLQKISMRFWGGQSMKVINNLKADENISQGIALSSIGLMYKTDLGSIKSSINSKGKFVALRGDSADSYINLINRVKDKYKKFLSTLEENYRLSYQKKDNGYKLSGGFTIIEFKNEIEDLESFANILTSCSNPFRLWGVWDTIDKDYLRIKGIDLHTNDKINIELTSNWMRIFLPENSCGNVISRLYTNLQHYFDSQITLRGNNNEKIIK